MFIEIVSAVVVSKLICDYITEREITKKIDKSVKDYFHKKCNKFNKKHFEKNWKKKDKNNGKMHSNQN